MGFNCWQTIMIDWQWPVGTHLPADLAQETSTQHHVLGEVCTQASAGAEAHRNRCFLGVTVSVCAQRPPAPHLCEALMALSCEGLSPPW